MHGPISEIYKESVILIALFMPKWIIVPLLNSFASKNVDNWEYKLFRLNLYQYNKINLSG